MQKVMVIMGGIGDERDISLASGIACSKALTEAGKFEVSTLEVKEDLEEFIVSIKKEKPDVVFNAMHGAYGEDGVIRGILDWFNIKSTHSARSTSALAMDKYFCSYFLSAAGIRFPDNFLCKGMPSKEEMKKLTEWPLIAKPRFGGSTLGVYFLESKKDLKKISSERFKHNMLIETFIPGREFTVSVINGQSLAVTEAMITDKIYDFERKYTSGLSAHQCPAKVSEEVAELMCNWAEKAHKMLDCGGVTRSDFRWNEGLGLEGLYMLEINTQPGMTAASLVPEQASIKGISFLELVSFLVEEATVKEGS